jgi:hypothetical protein
MQSTGFAHVLALPRGPRCARLTVLVAGLFLLPGCLAPETSVSWIERAVVDAARPILALDPDAVWTHSYNRLVELGPACVDCLLRRPAMTRPAAPDDLAVLLHTSLIRLLADPGSAPPRLSARCLEATFGLVHFDLQVQGRRVGAIVLPPGARPRAWPDLYPADFDHAVADQIDLEADRRALQEWWRRCGSDRDRAVTARPLEPQAQFLWPLLARRYADLWEYRPDLGAVLCTAPPRGPALLEVPTIDYNLVRAACVWLGSSSDTAVSGQLIELVGSPLSVVAHNARLALRYCPDERIQTVLRRHDPPGGAADGRD